MSTLAETTADPGASSTLLPASRPWSEFLSLSQLSLPVSLSDTATRLNSNLTFFRVNYAIISLIILFLSLIYHPISLILFLLTLIAWFFFYFSRTVPLSFFGREIDDRVVVIGLSGITILVLVFAGVWLNVIVSAAIAAVVVCLHGALRVPNYGDDHYGGLLSSVVEDPSGGYSEF